MRRPVAAISREDAQAREQRLTQTRHFDPIVNPTGRKYRRSENLWREFYEYIQLDPTQCLQRHESPPTTGRLKMFLEWVFDTTVGILTERITLKTLKSIWYSFRAAYERSTYTPIPLDTGKDVLSYIKTDLREKGLAMVRRHKEMADQLDAALMLNFLWCYDQYIFRHPRQLVQLSLILLLLIYTGARPGSIVESSAYRGSNEALCYKDFELICLPEPDGKIEYVLKVRFRYEKGRRARSNENDDGVSYKWVTFREDRSCRGRCPVTHFLGLAFADDAFLELREPDDLQYLRIPTHKHSIDIEFKESIKNTPVFRRIERDGIVSDYRAMGYDELARDLAQLGIRLGFLGLLKAYNLRRGTANSVDGNVEVSSNQYAQLLGHAVKTMGAFYISDISALDVQGLVNEERARNDHIQQLRRMTLHLDMRAPSKLPFRENQAILSNPEFIELLSIENNLYKGMQESRGNKRNELAKEHQKALFNRKRCYTRLYNQSFHDFRKQYFHSANSADIRKMIKDGKQGRTIEKDDIEVLELEFVSRSYFPDRHFVTTAFWVSCRVEKAGPDPALIGHLQNLCDPKPAVLYYPGESPVDGRCPICQLSIENIPPCNRPGHIHSCIATAQKARSMKMFQDQCPVQCKWGQCRNKFIAKQPYLPTEYGMHINNPQKRQQYRNKEAKRLHDLRRRHKATGAEMDSNLQPRKSISNHLKRHVENQTQCHWDKCQMECFSGGELRRHLYRDHSVSLRQAPFDPQFCLAHPDDGWYDCEFDWEDHCKTHMEKLPTNLNLVRAYHALLAGLHCPFCLGDETAVATKRWAQFTERGSFNVHIEKHKEKICQEDTLYCPLSSCSGLVFLGMSDLEIHFFDTHHLSPKGFARSRGFAAESHYTTNLPEDEGWDTETLLEGDDGWDVGTLHEDDDKGDWEDVSEDDEAVLMTRSPQHAITASPLKRKRNG